MLYLVKSMYAIIPIAFTLGLSFSVACTATCLPVLLPYITAAEHPTKRGGLYATVLFSFGKLIAYMTLGLLFGLLATSIEMGPLPTLGLKLALGGLLVIHGLSTLGILNIKSGILGIKSKIGSAFCSYITTKRAPVYLGILTSIRPCVSLIAALGYTITLPGISEITLFMLAFWLGSSLVVLLVGTLTGVLVIPVANSIRAERVRRIAGIAMLLIGMVFILQGLGLGGRLLV